MESRIVLLGATGYTGRLTAERLVADGERPLLAGRSEAKLSELAARLGGLEWARADAADAASVAAAVGPRDVLLTTVGPFAKYGEPALAAAIAAGGTYIDSTGEPAFIRRVFERHGPEAARSGATLLTAMGYDFVPGALAGALAVAEAGEEGRAVRVDVGYFALGAGPGSLSAGTRASLVGAALDGGFAYRDARLRSVRSAERVRSFTVKGREREAVSVGGAEHFTLPAAFPALREVNVYLGWFGGLGRVLSLATRGTEQLVRLPAVRTALGAAGERLMALGSGPEPGTTPGGLSWVTATAYDGSGAELSRVDLSGADPYAFTAGVLAWAARRAAAGEVAGTGAIGPVTGFGVDGLLAGCAEAGLARV